MSDVLSEEQLAQEMMVLGHPETDAYHWRIARNTVIASHRALAKERDELKRQVGLLENDTGLAEERRQFNAEIADLKRHVKDLEKAISICSGSCSRVMKGAR